jgi:hypothetical protein
VSRNKNFLDWTLFTTPSMGRDLVDNSIRKTLKYDVYQDKTKFKAIALTDMTPLSQEASNILDRARMDISRIPNSEIASMKNVRWIFRARILGANSPHNFIPDPCDTTYIQKKEDMATAMSYIQMHTQFITPTDFDFKRGAALVRKGDTVWVELDKNVVGYNLQMGRFISKMKAEHVSISRETGGETLPFYCDNLRDIFNDRDASRVPIVGRGPTTLTQPTNLQAIEARYAHEEGLGSRSDLLDFIAAGEVSAIVGYNGINAGGSGDRPGGSTQWPQPGPVFGPLTNMTIATLQAHQAKPRGDSTRIFAAGRYQFIPSTLIGTLRLTNLTGTDLFNATNQDALAVALIQSTGNLGGYLRKTKHDLRAAAIQLAMIWASVPHPDTGRSAHGNVGNNAAHHTVEQTYQALIRARGKF